jgi:hypothetical protein
MMSHTFRRLLLAAGATAALGALGTGVAFAAGPSAAPQTTTVSHATTSDGAEAVEKSGAADTVEQPGGESAGPGGHADPAGNVDHQFNGNE